MTYVAICVGWFALGATMGTLATVRALDRKGCPVGKCRIGEPPPRAQALTQPGRPT